MRSKTRLFLSSREARGGIGCLNPVGKQMGKYRNSQKKCSNDVKEILLFNSSADNFNISDSPSCNNLLLRQFIGDCCIAVARRAAAAYVIETYDKGQGFRERADGGVWTRSSKQ